jgi:hypothetical protein
MEQSTKYKSCLYLLSIVLVLSLAVLAVPFPPAYELEAAGDNSNTAKATIPVVSAAAVSTQANQQENVTDSGLPGWVPYVGGGILILLIFILGYLITRRNRTK